MKRYITTAIDYVNSLPHIGTAYEKIGADVLCRFYRLLGDDVVLHMGNDEHSVNVLKSAVAMGLKPKAYCDEMRPKFENVWKSLHIHYDQFIQTSEPRHADTVAKLFVKIHAAGDIYPRDYEGWYCESCEAFYTEKDLVNGECPNHKSKPKWLKEKNYFFKLSKYRDFLLEHIQKNPQFILPAKRRNEIVSLLKQGLEDISVSRSSFEWGIPLPIEKTHVVYVWFDALINYLTGADYLDESQKFKSLWPANLHIIGKDITRFHCVIWPAMLKSAGVELPQTILGHGFVSLKGQKMSKSLGNVVTPLDILNRYPDFGADALRYHLMRGSSFGDDGDFTWDDFILRYNSDLANGIGNLVSRTLGMVWRYQQGKVSPHQYPKVEQDLLQSAAQVFDEVKTFLDPIKSGDVQTHFAIEKIWAYISKIDQYIDIKQPWTLAKDPSKAQELSLVMTTLVEAIRLVAILVSPLIPAAAQKIWSAFGFEISSSFQTLRADQLLNVPFVKNDFQLPQEKLMIFPRIETKTEDSAAAAPDTATPSKQPATVPPPAQVNDPSATGLITFDEFGKVKLKVARVLSAEKVEKADKLLKLQIELGDQTRQIVAGVAEHYTPEQITGKNIIVVTNLKPAKIRGVESHGMLLAAKKDGKLTLVTVADDIASGADVG